MSYKVLLPQPILPEGYAYLREHGYEVVDGRGFTEEDILADIPGCDAMIVRTAKITGKILDAADKLKIIARHGAGYDNVDLEGARRNKVLAYDPFAKEVPEYIQLVEDRDIIFKESDYVSLHVPATKETTHSVSDREFDMMKETAFLINTARGAIVDEPALIRALETKKIAGTGLDTVEQEPFDLSNPLLDMENVLVAPHIGGATKEASTRSSVACAVAVDDYFSGRTPKFIVPELRDLVK